MRAIRNAVCIGLLIASFTYPALLRAQPASLPQPDAKPPKVPLASLAAQVAQLTQTVQSSQNQLAQLTQTVQGLQNQLASANAQNAFALGQFVTVDTKDTVNGLSGPHIIFTGANIHVRSGSGKTADNSGLGNLLVGYDADTGACGDNQTVVDAHRGGSHNLVVGDCHESSPPAGSRQASATALSENRAVSAAVPSIVPQVIERA